MSKQPSEGGAAAPQHPDNWSFNWKPRAKLTEQQERLEALRMAQARAPRSPVTLRKFSWEQDQ